MNKFCLLLLIVRLKVFSKRYLGYVRVKYRCLRAWLSTEVAITLRLLTDRQVMVISRCHLSSCHSQHVSSVLPAAARRKVWWDTSLWCYHRTWVTLHSFLSLTTTPKHRRRPLTGWQYLTKTGTAGMRGRCIDSLHYGSPTMGLLGFIYLVI